MNPVQSELCNNALKRLNVASISASASGCFEKSMRNSLPRFFRGVDGVGPVEPALKDHAFGTTHELLTFISVSRTAYARALPSIGPAFSRSPSASATRPPIRSAARRCGSAARWA